ncbi:MAG TPA: hypothetical protein ENI90_00020 [Methylothermaceae bacterium]|nr:hypothetical protein [Methylothermaceae bacterium]
MAKGFTVSLNGYDEALRALRRVERQIPRAAQRTVNYLANEVRKAEVEEMKRAFDRPTRWTLNSTRVTYASAARRRTHAVVWLKDEAAKGIPATKYLTPQIFGGNRKAKRFERALWNAGVLPRGWLAVPGEGARMDAFGNMSRGQIVEILSWFQAFGEQGFRANLTEEGRRRKIKGTKKRRGTAYFAIRPGQGSHLHPGVYQRIATGFGWAIKPVLIFIKSAEYGRRYHFFEVAEDTVFDRMEEAVAYGMQGAGL